jgi:hypothetical protein
VYFVQDAIGRLSLVVHMDAATTGNTDGGTAKLYIAADDIPDRGVQVIKYDDVGARNFSDGSWFGTCANIGRDCHSWDSTVSRGYFGWTWVRSYPTTRPSTAWFASLLFLPHPAVQCTPADVRGKSCPPFASSLSHGQDTSPGGKGSRANLRLFL